MKKIITFIFLVIVLAGCNHSTNLDNEGSGNDNLEDEENIPANKVNEKGDTNDTDI